MNHFTCDLRPPLGLQTSLLQELALKYIYNCPAIVGDITNLAACYRLSLFLGVLPFNKKRYSLPSSTVTLKQRGIQRPALLLDKVSCKIRQYRHDSVAILRDVRGTTAGVLPRHRRIRKMVYTKVPCPRC